MYAGTVSLVQLNLAAVVSDTVTVRVSLQLSVSPTADAGIGLRLCVQTYGTVTLVSLQCQTLSLL